MHIVDWMPTFTKLVGYTPGHNPQWDGVDIWPLLKGENQKIENRSMFWNFRGMDFGIRKNGWKLITKEAMEPEKSELYNLDSDPYETQNLAQENPTIVKDFLDMIACERELDGSSVREDMK